MEPNHFDTTWADRTHRDLTVCRMIQNRVKLLGKEQKVETGSVGLLCRQSMQL
jgi:hypothetical protein